MWTAWMLPEFVKLVDLLSDSLSLPTILTIMTCGLLVLCLLLAMVSVSALNR